MNRLFSHLLLVMLLPCGSQAAVSIHQGTEPRIAALSWEVTEHVLQLGITPVAVADAADYRTWVVNPTLPETVPNAGTRGEPNLELLAQLRPDLILITPLLADIRDKLERIAPVAIYENFTQNTTISHYSEPISSIWVNVSDVATQRVVSWRRWTSASPFCETRFKRISAANHPQSRFSVSPRRPRCS